MADRTAFGHIKISRKAFDAEHGDDFWHEPRVFSRFEAWLDLIQLAQWSRRNHAGTMLERGQFVASVRTLALRWRWSKSRVNRYLATVEKSGRVAGQGTTAHGTVYLIVKYDSYQSANAVESPESGTPRGTAAGQQRDKNKQEKQESNTTLPFPGAGNERPASDYPPEFDAAWKLYPSRGSYGNAKRPAHKAWAARIAEGIAAADLHAATVRYAAATLARGKVGTEFVLAGSTFYGPNERWKEYVGDAPVDECRNRAAAWWERAKRYNLTSPVGELETQLAAMVAAGAVTDAATFRREVAAVKPWALAAKAQTTEWAIGEVAKRLATA